MGAGRMADVQLEDADGPAPPDAPAPEPARARRARALLRRWWPLPVAGAVAVVAWQVAADARAESAAEALRATPGVISSTVTAPLDATWVASPELASALYGGVRTPSGLVAGLVPGDPSEPVRVHRGDHAVRTERDLDPGAAATVVGGTLVVGTPGEDSVRLVATDAGTGEQRWAADVPAPLA